MSTLCQIGVLDADGRTFLARDHRQSGYPSYLLPALGEALHDHHDGDLARLTAAIMKHDWFLIDADQATAEVRDPSLRPPYREARMQPTTGIGYHDTDSSPTAWSGNLANEPDARVDWLYLVADGNLRVYYVAYDRWDLWGTFSVLDLADPDVDDLVVRESAVGG